MKKFLRNNLISCVLFVLLLAMCIVIGFYNRILSLAALSAMVAVFIVALIFTRLNKRRAERFISNLAGVIDLSVEQVVENFPLPVLVCTQNAEIKWYSELFKKNVIGDLSGKIGSALDFLEGESFEELMERDKLYTRFNKRFFSVLPKSFVDNGEKLYALIFVDETELSKLRQDYISSRPRVMLAVIDNLDEVYQGYSDSDYQTMRVGVEKLVDDWFSEHGCLVRKLSDGRFIAICEEVMFENMRKTRFDVLDKVRNYSYDDKQVGITLSIGVGSGKSFPDCEKNARLALDMAVSRGGDQAAVMTKDNYDFFGGVSRNVERRNKTKSRIVASAISKLIEGSENVLIMGHKFSDMDSLGASFGLYYACSQLGANVKIVINGEQTLAGSLLEYISGRFANAFISPDMAAEMTGKNTLLIIADTHRVEVLESAEAYKKAKTVVVIDHHRKNVDFIDNSLVFCHDPNASSTCEMVTELLQHFATTSAMPPEVSVALLSGIMLDTKYFTLKTGTRTFEAAAYLRGKGADTVKAKQLFMNKMESFMLRNEVIAAAYTYRECAIARADIESQDLRIIASQAADELLNVDGVKASFVMFASGNMINISARSLGDMNVQLIMEYLGGGGHQTMAAAQLTNVDEDTATSHLIEAIDNYYLTNKKK